MQYACIVSYIYIYINEIENSNLFEMFIQHFLEVQKIPSGVGIEPTSLEITCFDTENSHLSHSIRRSEMERKATR